MTSEFEGFEHDLLAEDQNAQSELTPDSFELLSAYIDDELSPADKEQVQNWLDCDPEFKQLYTQLLNLQGQIQNFTVPQDEKSTAEITAGVFQSIDRSRLQRRKLVWGGSAIAATIIATVSGLFGGFSPQLAKIDSPDSLSNSVMLAVTVDQPAINIPKSVNGYLEQQ